VEIRGRKTVLAGVLDPDDGDPSVGRDQAVGYGHVPTQVERSSRVAGTEHVGQLSHLDPQPRQRGARGTGIEEGPAAIYRGDDDLGCHSLLAGARPFQQLRGPLGVQPRGGHRVRGLPAKDDGGGDRERGGEQPRSDHPPRMAGCAPSKAGKGFREHRVLQPRHRPAIRPSMTRIVGADPLGIGSQAADPPVPGRSDAPFFRPMRAVARSLG
jgi:hypothetical protein